MTRREREILADAREILARLTGKFEDASAIAANAQSVRSRSNAKRADRDIRLALSQIERQLAQLEVLLE